MTEFKFGYSGSSFSGVAQLVDLAVRSEQAGFDVFVLTDLPGGLSPLVTLAAVAQRTSTIKVAPFVLNTGLYNPATIGRDLATLQLISGRRLEIVLGSGMPQPSISEVMPSTRDARYGRLAETLRTIKATFADPGLTSGYGDTPPVCWSRAPVPASRSLRDGRPTVLSSRASHPSPR